MSGLVKGGWRIFRRGAGFAPERVEERHGNEKTYLERSSRFGLLNAQEQQIRKQGAKRAARTMAERQQRLGGGG